MLFDFKDKSQNWRKKAEPGNFYAVGVGPGAPDLLTLRAIDLIGSADWIIAPRSRASSASMALEIARPFIGREQEVYEHFYAMRRDEKQTQSSWAAVAALVAERLMRGQAVAQITVGDPLLYSTTCYLMEQLGKLIGPDQIHLIPGVSAFQAAAARHSQILTIQEDRMMIMPATDLAAVEKALGGCETLVLYKAGRLIDRLTDLLVRKGIDDRALVACYVEQPGRETLTNDLKKAAAAPNGYMATVIINQNRKKW